MNDQDGLTYGIVAVAYPSGNCLIHLIERACFFRESWPTGIPGPRNGPELTRVEVVVRNGKCCVRH
jgi:hypothetical protein